MDSPEDKLLRLIKGTYEKKPSGDGQTPKRRFGLMDIVEFIRGQKNIFSHQTLVKMNAVLGVIVVALAVLFAGSFFMQDSRLSIPVNEGREARRAPDSAPVPLPAGTPDAAGADADTYIKAVSSKGLFQGGESSGDLAGNAELSGGSKAADPAKRFNLVGIIPGDQPQAIVEDIESAKTYYLNKGQSVAGIEVEDIADGRVVISFNGRRIVLVL